MIQDKKKNGEVGIYVDLGNLNDACMHDPFPTSFRDEVIESVEGKDMYSFIDEYYGYHQVRLVKED